jgi:hypothetical protein
MGRKDRECGQMGVSSMAGTLGCTMEPPADTEYAVLPVGAYVHVNVYDYVLHTSVQKCVQKAESLHDGAPG